MISQHIHSNKKFIYWYFPLIVGIILLLFNYSGIDVLQWIISPPINREFGLVENLQLIAIVFLAILAFKGISRQKYWFENLGFGFLGFIFIFAFLEEMDYGLHYYEYLFKDGVENKRIVRNFHNSGDNNFYVRQFLIIMMALIFVLLPWLRWKDKIKNRYVLFFCADKMIIGSFIVYLIISQLARRLPELGLPVNPSLVGNHQEFEELVSYFIMYLYLYEIVNIKEPFFQNMKVIDQRQ